MVLTQPAPAPERPHLARVLGRVDLLLFSVSAILTIDTLASAASMGVTWFAWWGITVAPFFLPSGLVMAELGAAWPDEGGLYVWVREGLGPAWGSMAAWLYWINAAYWLPSIFLVFAGTLHAIALRHVLPAWLQAGPARTWLEAAIAVALTWITVGIGILRLEVSKWIPSLGAVVKIAILLSLGALGIASLLQGRPPANDFSLGQFLPNWGASLNFLPVLVYNALGFELMNAAGEEMRNPQRDVPRVILLGGVLIAIVYTLGILGILLAVPLSQLSLVTGTWDALEVLGQHAGRAANVFVLLLGVGFLWACVSSAVTWALGVNRVAAVAAEDAMLPAFMGRLHPRFKTPTAAFVAMGAVSTLLLLGNALMS